MFLLEKCGCVSSNPVTPQASIDIASLTIVSAPSPRLINLSITAKYSLSFTMAQVGDCLLVHKLSAATCANPETIDSARIQDPKFLFKVKSRGFYYEGSAELKLSVSPDTYCVLYLRPLNRFQEEKPQAYKILGSSQLFKLEVMGKEKLFQEEARTRSWRPLRKEVTEEFEVEECEKETTMELSEGQIERFFRDLEALKSERP